MSEPITAELLTAFRSAQPAFSDLTKWPDGVVTEAVCEADAETGSVSRWGVLDINDCRNFKRRGMFFYAAHWLSITYNTAAGATDPSKIDAAARLNLAAKSVGDESVSFRITAIQSAEDDFLSLTSYGVQYLRLRRRSAMGARAV